jgi:hypothetical protein
LCGRTGTERDQRLGCSVLTDAGWTFRGVGRDLAWGDPASRAFVRSGTHGVSYCRTVAGAAGDRAACTRFDAARNTWGPDRAATAAERTLADSRTWQVTGSGPALCGHAGNEGNQRVACTVLTPRGWTTARSSESTARGNPGTFVPSDRGGLSYCRSITPPSGPARLACSALEASGRAWRHDRVSGPAHLTYSDPF